MNTTGRWLARIGGLVIVVGFFLPAVAVSGTGNVGFLSQLFGGPDLPNVTVRLYTPSLSEIANNPFSSAAFLLYLVPLGALAVVILTLLTSDDPKQEVMFLLGQVAAVGFGALAVIVAVISAYSETQSYLGLFSISVSPEIGLFVLILSYAMAITGIVMQYAELPLPQMLRSVSRRRQPRGQPLAPAPAYAPAWLLTRNGREHQLRQGLTRVGRSSRNDIVLAEDTTVSREHAKILEENGHYRLVDLGGPGGTRVNGQRVRGQMILESDDEVQFGKNTVVRFVTARR